MQTCKLSAYAKINLALDVLEKRPDGYHDISAVFYETSLADELEFSLTTDDGIHIESTGLPCPDADDNLITKALRLVFEQAGYTGGCHVAITKRIPQQAGLGGGSSDAAAALVAAAEMTDYTGPLDTLALELGSDVPFFLKGSAAYATGRGENLQTIATDFQLPLLLVKPDIGVPTAWAYQALSREPYAGTGNFGIKMTEALVSNDRDEVFGAMGNDFELVVLKEFPDVGRLKNRLEKCGALISMLCGSGSCLFAVFNSVSDAEAASAHFSDVWTAVVSGLPRLGKQT